MATTDLNQFMNQLATQIQNKVNLTLQTNVAETVKEQISEIIVNETYTAYASQAVNPYVRRGLEDGLADTRNMTMDIVDSNTVSIKNETKGNENYSGYYNGNIDAIIVQGTGYSWAESQIYGLQPFPRDFYTETVQNMEINKSHVVSMKLGLESKGLTVK